MRMSLEEYQKTVARIQKTETAQANKQSVAEQFKDSQTKRKAKYGNRKFTADGVMWDSEKEYRRFKTLQELERYGAIQNLARQVPFQVIEPVVIHGKRERATIYIADFTYKENGKLVVEDAKSEITRKIPVYRLKRKLMKLVHNIEIKEV